MEFPSEKLSAGGRTEECLLHTEQWPICVEGASQGKGARSVTGGELEKGLNQVAARVEPQDHIHSGEMQTPVTRRWPLLPPWPGRGARLNPGASSRRTTLPPPAGAVSGCSPRPPAARQARQRPTWAAREAPREGD